MQARANQRDLSRFRALVDLRPFVNVAGDKPKGYGFLVQNVPRQWRGKRKFVLDFFYFKGGQTDFGPPMDDGKCSGPTFRYLLCFG